MSVRFCALRKFIEWDNSCNNYKWKWGRLGMKHTYVVIFGPGDVYYRRAFNKVKHQVNIVKEIGPCWNTKYPGTLRNTVVIFEKLVASKEAPSDANARTQTNESGSQV